MKNLKFILALLFSFSWTMKSDFEFYSLVVQPDEDVTLLCSNYSISPEHILWFKLTDGPNVSRISSIGSSESEVRLYDGYQHEKFDMTTNGTNIFLDIKQLNFSDSGVYICGFKLNNRLVIYSETYLKVEDGFDGFNKLLSVILGSAVIFLVAVIVRLVCKINTLRTAQTNRHNQRHNENRDADALNYAALHFRPKPNHDRKPASEGEIDPNVFYAATR